MRLAKDQSMSPRCGFGIVNLTPALIMKGCLPIWYGPSQPEPRSRRISSLRLIGFGMGRLFAVQVNVINHRQRMAQLEAQ